MKTIFKNDKFEIKDTEHYYDFRYVIENITDRHLNIYLDGLDDYIDLKPNAWMGLFDGEYSDDIVSCLIDGAYSWNYIEEMI